MTAATPPASTTNHGLTYLLVGGAALIFVAAIAIGVVAVAMHSSSKHRRTVSSPPGLHEPAVTGPNFPKMQVTPGVNNAFESTAPPLFEIRGTGSQASPPLTLSTTNLIGGATPQPRCS